MATVRTPARQGSKAAAYARKRVTSGWRAARTGICQIVTRGNSGTPSSGGSATIAWNNAVKHGKVIKSTNPAKYPIGAAVMWTGGSQGYGHAATYVGNGKCATTDWSGPREYDYANVLDVAKAWSKMRLVGCILVDGNGYEIAKPIEKVKATGKYKTGRHKVTKAPTNGRCLARRLPNRTGGKNVTRRLKLGRRPWITRIVKSDGLYWGVAAKGDYIPMKNLTKV